MINLSDKSISELEQVLINYENEEFEKVQSCAIELRNRGNGILKATVIAKHFGLSDVNDLFKSKNDIQEVDKVEKNQTGKLNSVFLELSKSFGTILNCIIISIIVNIFYILILFNSDKFIPGFAIIVSVINLVLFIIILNSISKLNITSKDASNMDFNKN
jgi:hypothetical protein